VFNFSLANKAEKLVDNLEADLIWMEPIEPIIEIEELCESLEQIDSN